MPKTAKIAVLAVFESKIIGVHPAVLDIRLTNPDVQDGKCLRALNTDALPESGKS